MTQVASGPKKGSQSYPDGSTTVGTTELSEILQWEGPTLVILRDNREETGVLSKSSNSYTITSRGAGRETEVSYYLDLRYDLYSFYEYDVAYDGSATRRDGTVTSSGNYTFSEMHRIVSNLGPGIITFSNTYARATQPVFSELATLKCVSDSSSDTSYTHNFGWMWPQPVGSWVVDGQGNLLVSQAVHSNLGGKHEKFYNFITGGNLGALIPGGGPDAVYLSVGVVR